jgi:hypothetical protein
MKIIYQYTPKNCLVFTSLKELVKNLPYKRYESIKPTLGRGITLQVGDDKDFIVIPKASRNRVCRLLNNMLVY